MLNSCQTARLGAPVDLMNAQLQSETGSDGLGRTGGAKDYFAGEDTDPETGDTPSETEATVQEHGDQVSEEGLVNQGEDRSVWGEGESVLGEGDTVSKDLGKRVTGKGRSQKKEEWALRAPMNSLSRHVLFPRVYHVIQIPS
ncbi:hypothetical protein KFL_006420070 [Klebsormidium nitens]|uniref:Uncharacterized protein n=1 Tax=Klebsormidium nitens TaxID=105231 RepID=A0A1Y1IMT4_KLENI|nr:hypothetical protein KFL_006420070 [Klebsormidium nitens]|eukprot:GAQ90461.1 hypothetical protein KFL_006420070 [Klebsormidium nitens]